MSCIDSQDTSARVACNEGCMIIQITHHDSRLCYNAIVGPQVRLASVRRSLFSNEAERAKFLNHLARGTRELLRSQQGLAEHANYHEFCRLLGRLKTNYQLSELVRS